MSGSCRGRNDLRASCVDRFQVCGEDAGCFFRLMAEASGHFQELLRFAESQRRDVRGVYDEKAAIGDALEQAKLPR